MLFHQLPGTLTLTPGLARGLVRWVATVQVSATAAYKCMFRTNFNPSCRTRQNAGKTLQS